ncbi:MAG: TetR/AcrR family transcriptional regulator [Candidatus Binatia bacterium]
MDQDGRERILAVAVRCFSELGYEGTTTAAVARDAGVTQPLVHHHFGSKEGLWRAAMDALFSDVAPIVGTPTEGSPRERLLAITQRFLHFAATHPNVTRVMAREGTTPGPRLTYIVDRYLRAPFRQVVDAVRTGQRTGLIVPDVRPDLLVFLILGAGSFLFDMTALARESLGIDAGAAATQHDFFVLVQALFEHGLFHPAARHRRARRKVGARQQRGQ